MYVSKISLVGMLEARTIPDTPDLLDSKSHIVDFQKVGRTRSNNVVR